MNRIFFCDILYIKEIPNCGWQKIIFLWLTYNNIQCLKYLKPVRDEEQTTDKSDNAHRDTRQLGDCCPQDVIPPSFVRVTCAFYTRILQKCTGVFGEVGVKCSEMKSLHQHSTFVFSLTTDEMRNKIRRPGFVHTANDGNDKLHCTPRRRLSPFGAKLRCWLGNRFPRTRGQNISGCTNGFGRRG
jgi:hypothetical protein